MSQRSVAIDISVNLTGTDINEIRGIFSALKDAVGGVAQQVNKLDDQLRKLKTPPALNQVVTELEKLKKLRIPNLQQIATGFGMLARMGTPPNLDPFIEQIRKFTGLKIPNLLNIAKGFEILSGESIKMVTTGKRLRIAYRQIKRFSDLKLPNLRSIASGLRLLSDETYRLNKIANIFTQVARALASFNQTAKLPNLVHLAKGIGAFSNETFKLNKIRNIFAQVGKSLRAFPTDIKFPNFGLLAKGLQAIASKGVDIKAVVGKILSLERALRRLAESGRLTQLLVFASALNAVSASVTKIINPTRKAGKAVRGLGDDMEKTGKRGLTFAQRIKVFAHYTIIMQSVMLLRDAMRAGTTAIFEYSQGLKDVQAITGATNADLQVIGKTIKDIAQVTKFSVGEIATGMRILGQTGMDASQAMMAMQHVADLATGTLSEMENVVDLTTTALRVFAVDAVNTQSITDGFANAVNKSKLTIDKLRIAFNYVGPIARDIGVTFAGTQAALMTLANSGIRASTMGTGLRRVLARLASPTKKFQKAVAAAGLSLTDFDTQALPLHKVMSNLRLVVQDAGTAFELFGKRGAPVVLALTSMNSGLKTNTLLVQESGTAAEMAAIQIEGLQVMWKNLQDTFGLLAVTMGEAGLDSVFKFLISSAKTLLDTLIAIGRTDFGKFSFAFAGISTIVAGVTASAIALKVAFAGAFGAMIISKIVAVKLAVIALAGPIGIVAAALAALVTGFMAVTTHANRFKKAMDESLAASRGFQQASLYMDNYNKSVSKLKEGTDELRAENLKLLSELIKVSHGTTDIAKYAHKAALSIDPLTGKINDQTKAIEDYHEAVNRLALSKLVEHVAAMNKELEGGGRLRARVREINRGDTSLADKIIRKARAKNIREMVIAGKAGANELGRYVEGLKIHKKMFPDEEFLVDIFERAEVAAAEFASRADAMGMKLDFSNTVEEVEGLWQGIIKNDLVLSVFLENFSKLKKAAEGVPEDIIDSWSMADATDDLEQYLKVFQKTADAQARRAIPDTGTEEQIAAAKELAALNIQATANTTAALLATIKNNRTKRAALIEEKQINEELLKQELEQAKTVEETAAARQRYGKENNRLLQEAKRISVAFVADDGIKQLQQIKAITIASEEQAAALKKLYRKTPDAEALHKGLAEIEFDRDRKLQDVLTFGFDSAGTIEEAEEMIELIETKFASEKIELQIKAVTEGIDTTDEIAEAERAKNKKILALREGLQEKLNRSDADAVVVSEQQVLLSKARLAVIDTGVKTFGRKIRTESQKTAAYVRKKQAEINKIIAKMELAQAKDPVDETEFELQVLQERLRSIDEIIQKEEQLVRITTSDEKVTAELALNSSIVTRLGLLKDIVEIESQRRDNARETALEEISHAEAYNKALLARKRLESDRGAGGDSQLEIAKAGRFEQERIRSKIAADQGRLRIAIEEGNADKIKNIQLEIFQHETDLMTSQLETHRAVMEERVRVMEDGWRRGIVSVEEYYAAVEAARSAGAISQEKANERQMVATGGMWDGFKSGFSEAGAEAKTTFETMAEVGEYAFNAIGDGFATALEGIVTGSMSAGQAFSQMAASILMDIGKMIVKMAILNAMKSLNLFAEGGSVGGAATQSLAGGGGVHGVSPHPKADNIPIWATAGEFMQPVKSVRYYGTKFMEMIRTLQFPKELARIATLGNFNIPTPIGNYLAEGGMPSGGVAAPEVSLNVVNFVDKNLMGEYLSTVEGEKTMLNFLNVNRNAY